MRPAGKLLLVCLTLLCACDRNGTAPTAKAENSAVSQSSATPAPRAPTRSPKASKNAYDVPERTPVELAAELKQACGKAAERDAGVLLEFTAPWCKDCRVLKRMEQAGALKEELKQWELLPINIRDPEQHESLTEAFGVRAIAFWQALAPSQCDALVEKWPRLAQRSVEPTSKGASASLNALSGWLRSARRKLPKESP